MKTHYKKILPQYFNEVVNGNKPFELRVDDCNYKVGDTLVLKEFKPKINEEFTGREISKEISYVLHGGQYGLEKDYCILGLKLEGINLVNIDLTGITASTELLKVIEENNEFESAVFECLCNPIDENRKHAIEEFWDKVQSSLSYLQVTLGIKADEVMEQYNLHLEKIKNRPR
ncbi:hypothetical protein CLOBY_27400 [Clostridium saccharobutylicum]|uniref:ASCH/PUA domain-containing protein n=1 Tax=Clostridium saccharobutylicum TaxID=169679 RepID=UPI00098403B3|nr:ASCH/PUA domain-containing protein [Clostridium saccharobutylicum]AQS10595.1 hypothetical protein CLOBY_27400 [Clostridium saccharobutylicum]MBC2438052.1 DUF3850 domain-containing protein [Clostridium saccharobutylicum]NSB90495.1 hypothetical protein [Clostridium saccharobutylicum]NYC31550.1 hypothetical protein [Clostridium saccharobutylicum]OOM18868.1 hypothetical protein CLSAB_03260 [Clostridium saccharobutylicum]